MTSVELHHHLASLSKKRPVFHSEADFQHELALELSRSGYQVRLEVPREVMVNGTMVHVEIDLLAMKDTITALELKYVKRSAMLVHGGESFELPETWLTNLSRFDCLADLRRVEALVAADHSQQGFSVFLTNANNAWLEDASTTTNMARDFSIHEGRAIPAGTPLDWNPSSPSVGSVSAKRLAPYAPITIRRAQMCRWSDYSDLRQPNGAFRCLVLET